MHSILHVVNVYFVIPYFLGDQLMYFKKKGYNMHVVCSPNDQLEAYSSIQGFKYAEIPILRKISLMQDLKSVFSIWKYIRDNHIDIVNGHTPKGGLLAMVASFFAGVPTRIYFRHGLLYETSTGFNRCLLLFMERLTSLFATKVICVSPYLIDKSIHDKLTKRDKLYLLNRGSCNGVDTIKKFNPEAIQQSYRNKLKIDLGLPDNAWVIGYTGRIVKDKGIVELVESFSVLKRKFDNIYLLLVGPKEDRDSLPLGTLQLIESDQFIIYTGLVDENIEYYYSLMNVLVLATHREGLGTSILEASSMQIPVLTTAHTGSRDAIVDGFTGLYVKTFSDSICSALEKLYNNRELSLELGAQGRMFVLNNFDQHIIWSEIEKIY